jgi:hypothetical protein
MDASGQLDDPAALPRGEVTPGSHWIEGYIVGHRVRLDILVEL